MKLPYLTADQPGIGGALKVEPEDFIVEEIPLYEPCGEGQHLYALLEKRGLSTYSAVNKIARALDIRSSLIGYAGLKDAHAITRQMISIDNVEPDAVQAIDIPRIKVLSLKRHRNKLKIGHLAGNRFVIKVRQVTEAALPIARTVLAALEERGVPNFYGEQRFGNRGNTQRLGEALIRQDVAEFVPEYLGRPQSQEAPYIRAARHLVDEGRWAEALEKWPPNLHDERRVLQAIVKAGGRIEVAFEAFTRKKLRSFFVSAYQSYLFNQLLAERIETLDKLEVGDVAYIHRKGAAFVVKDAAAEQPRVERFEISPSGPLFGPKTLLAEGEPGRRERAVLAEQALTLEEFNLPGLKVRGTRRPYRIKVKHPKIWWDDGLMVSFELPPGAYATRVLAEIMKNQ